MDYTLLVEAATPLVLAVIGMILQELKRRDTNAHGDAILTMLKGSAETVSKVVSVFPQVAPIAQQYMDIVAEADKVWNAGGMTATDIAVIAAQAKLLKAQIDAAVASVRTLKAPVT